MKKLLKIEATFPKNTTFNHKVPDQFNEKIINETKEPM
jgi:hypothetical protein